MASSSIEYIVATVCIGLLFINVVHLFNSAFYPSALHSDELRLNEASETGLQNLLMSFEGDKGEEGPGASLFLPFLDMEGSDAKSPIVLDPDRVALLNEDNPFGYVSYEDFQSQSGLEGYDFKLIITLPFDVDVQLVESNTTHLKFLVTLRNEQTPLFDALVEAYMIYVTEEYTYITTSSSRTSVEGEAIVDVPIPSGNQDYVVLFHFVVGDLSGWGPFIARYYKELPILDIWYFDEAVRMKLNQRPDQGAARIRNIIGVVGSNLVVLHNSTKATWNGDDKLTWSNNQWKYWTMPGIDDVSLVITTFDAGQNWIELGYHYMPLTATEYGISYGREPKHIITESSTAVSIAGIIYELDLFIWETDA